MGTWYSTGMKWMIGMIDGNLILNRHEVDDWNERWETWYSTGMKWMIGMIDGDLVLNKLRWRMRAGMKLMIGMIDGDLVLNKLRWRTSEIASEYKALSCSRMAENRSVVVST